jgi:methionyl-tRNA formyltransferase
MVYKEVSSEKLNAPNQRQSITLLLMTEKGYKFLKNTVKKYKSLYSLVVVGNDKAILKDYEDEIVELCIKENIDYIKKSEFTEVKSKYAMAISWRWLIKHPPEKLIVFHDSLLPKYRGFAPLVNGLINGDKTIGVTAIFGANEFDTGDIIVQSKSNISYPITISEAIRINNKNFLECAEIVLSRLLHGDLLTASKQIESEASYSVWRDENDYKIDWSKSDVDIQRMVDAVGFPYKGASTFFEGRLIRILSVERYPDVKIENRHYGKVLFLSDGKPVVICGKGMLKITEAFIEEEGAKIAFFPISKFRIRFGNC